MKVIERGIVLGKDSHGVVYDLIKDDEGVYRYVNHEVGICTTGFMSMESLDKYKDIIRFDKGTYVLMKDRYNKMFGALP